MTFLEFDKKDWLHKKILVDNDKEKIQCLVYALFLDPNDGYVWHELADRYADLDNQTSARYCWLMSEKSYLERLEKFKEDSKKYKKDSSHLLFMDVNTTEITKVISNLYFNLGSIYDNLEKYSLSGESFQKSFKLNNENSDALYYGARAFRTCKKFDEAIELFLKHIVLTGDYHSHYYLGIIKHEQNDIRNSLGHFWACIESAGNDAESCIFKHLSFWMLGNYKKAKYYLLKAHKLEPEDPQRCLDLIEFLEECGNKENTNKYYNLLHKMHKKKKLEEIR